MGKAGETPGRLHNCCSGKHAGMLATARHLGLQAAGYERFDHPLQARIRDVMADVFQADMESAPCGIDGCSLPTLAVPLSRLARGFARLTGDAAIALERRAAADRLMRACMSNPHAVGGTGKFDTDVMAAFEGAVFLKFGAEAVYVIVFPALRIAAAVKIDDGAVRAAEAVAAAIISRFAVGTAAQSDFIEGYLKAPQRNAMGVEVGYVQPVSELRKALTTL